jgi:hypothetical protein
MYALTSIIVGASWIGTCLHDEEKYAHAYCLVDYVLILQDNVIKYKHLHLNRFGAWWSGMNCHTT